jgi:pimeloyl-ACP methyl ester carboxylesterase
MKRLVMFIVLAVLALLGGAGAWLYTPDKPRSELDAAYHVAPADYVEADGIRLRLRDSGPREAPALIMLHGFGSSLETWDGWAARLDGRFRVIRFDLPGFGLTGADPGRDYTDAHDVQVLLALMDRLSLPRATLIGNSMGGKIAWHFASQYPGRVDRLVLVSPDGFASPGFTYGEKPKVPAFMQMLRYTLPTAMVRMSLAPAYVDHTKLTPALVARYRDMMLAPGVRGAILDRMGQVLPQDPTPLLRRIEAPTLLVWGRRDGMIPFANSGDYLKAIPHSTLAALPHLGHVAMEEAPDESLAPVLPFLAPLLAASAAPH